MSSPGQKTIHKFFRRVPPPPKQQPPDVVIVPSPDVVIVPARPAPARPNKMPLIVIDELEEKCPCFVAFIVVKDVVRLVLKPRDWGSKRYTQVRQLVAWVS